MKDQDHQLSNPRKNTNIRLQKVKILP